MLHRLIGFLILAASIATAWVWMNYREVVETPLAIPDSGVIYEVKSGATVGAVGRDLAQMGLLSNARWLSWYARWKQQAQLIKAGEYRLEKGLTPPALLGVLISGRSIEHTLTLIEGWNFRQVRAAIEGHEILAQTLKGLSDDAVMSALGHADEHPEGRFFPDTYSFPRGTTDLEFLSRAYDRMALELANAWREKNANLPLKTAYEALILASIVEKETGVPSERPAIAGVFIRRLQRGMKLQTDPTVIYGMGESFDGNIRRADLRDNTPYNTYVISGLPPTPICMPGKAALLATVKPAGGEELYFVARGDGSHQFSPTLTEHNKAVRKYQLKQQP